MSRDTFQYPRVLPALSSVALDTARDGNPQPLWGDGSMQIIPTEYSSAGMQQQYKKVERLVRYFNFLSFRLNES